MLRELLRDRIIRSLLALLAIFFALIAVMLADLIFASSEDIDAEVVSRSHQNAQVQTGTGVGVDGNGNAAVVVVTTSSPEKWTVIVKADSAVFAAAASPLAWANSKPGTAVVVRVYRGRFFGGFVGANVLSVSSE